jgi:glycosyltransferase involved in cell wall biosynthesis
MLASCGMGPCAGAQRVRAQRLPLRPRWQLNSASWLQGLTTRHAGLGIESVRGYRDSRALLWLAGYAYEIQMPEGGWGMEFVLGTRQYALNGVLNGIDYDTWNPTKDSLIPATYSQDNLEGKKRCKAELQKELGLPQDENVPLIAFIGRLDSQKGADLILASAAWIMQQVHRPPSNAMDLCTCMRLGVSAWLRPVVANLQQRSRAFARHTCDCIQYACHCAVPEVRCW